MSMLCRKFKRFPQTLSVVVCTYDRYDLLDNVISSLLHQSLKSIEIVVVDNSPDEERARSYEQWHAKRDGLTYIIEPKPGLSRARNIGIVRSQGSVIAFLDDDAVADPDWAGEVLKTFEEFPGNVGVVGGPTVPRWSAPRPEWLTDKLLRYLSIVQWGGETRELQAGEWLVGCNIAFRRAMLDKVGRFSETLGRSGAATLLSNEETQVVDLIRAGGGLIVYNPCARVEHTIDVYRLNELWFYRRAAWQAVSDFLSDTEKSRQHAHKIIERIMPYIDTEHFQNRTEARVDTVYNTVLSCLTGEVVFGTKNSGRRGGSRLLKNLNALPIKTIRKIKAIFES